MTSGDGEKEKKKSPAKVEVLVEGRVCPEKGRENDRLLVCFAFRGWLRRGMDRGYELRGMITKLVAEKERIGLAIAGTSSSFSKIN